MKKALIALLAILLILGFYSATAKQDHDEAAQLLKKILNNQADIIQRFEVDPHLSGFVVDHQSHGKTIAFARKDGSLLITGSLITPDGRDLTREYFNQYIAEPESKNIVEQSAALEGFLEGSDHAAHKLTILMEPKCGYCKMQYRLLQPLIKAGQVQVKWVMVGYLKPESTAISAYILSGADNKTRLKRLKDNEINSTSKSVDMASTDPIILHALQNVKENTAFFNQYQTYFVGTPTVIYRDKAKKPHFHAGFVRKEKMAEFLSQVGNSW